MKLRVTAVILTYIILAAHFSRAGLMLLSLLCLLLPLLLLVKQRWSLITIQVIAYLGALEWLRSTIVLVLQRMNRNEDWTRMAIILGMVMLFTFWTGLSLNKPVIKDKFPK